MAISIDALTQALREEKIDGYAGDPLDPSRVSVRGTDGVLYILQSAGNEVSVTNREGSTTVQPNIREALAEIEKNTQGYVKPTEGRSVALARLFGEEPDEENPPIG